MLHFVLSFRHWNYPIFHSSNLQNHPLPYIHNLYYWYIHLLRQWSYNENIRLLCQRLKSNFCIIFSLLLYGKLFSFVIIAILLFVRTPSTWYNLIDNQIFNWIEYNLIVRSHVQKIANNRFFVYFVASAVRI